MKVWGYWATFGWALLAFVVGQFLALAVLVWLRLGDVSLVLTKPFDGAMITLFIVIANPLMIAVLALAVRLARARQVDYFALVLPRLRDLALGLVCLVGLIVVSDALLYVSGRDLVTPFQLQSYASATAEGWLPALLAAAILIAPAGEELMFRGFIFRGWARSDRTAWPAIVVISVLWAALHIQYDWAGVLQIFVIGLFLGWMRWRSGSIVLTFVLHALFNLEGTLETAAQIWFFS
jgi:membrane protease YdiL (CAAX protease family)